MIFFFYTTGGVGSRAKHVLLPLFRFVPLDLGRVFFSVNLIFLSNDFPSFLHLWVNTLRSSRLWFPLYIVGDVFGNHSVLLVLPEFLNHLGKIEYYWGLSNKGDKMFKSLHVNSWLADRPCLLDGLYIYFWVLITFEVTSVYMTSRGQEIVFFRLSDVRLLPFAPRNARNLLISFSLRCFPLAGLLWWQRYSVYVLLSSFPNSVTMEVKKPTNHSPPTPTNKIHSCNHFWHEEIACVSFQRLEI